VINSERETPVKKNKLVPTVDCLESRIALSGGIKFIGGVPVLTTSAIAQAKNLIQTAYTKFATKQLNYALLSADLGKAAALIPWANRDDVPGTSTTLYVGFTQVAPAGLKAAIQNKVANPVKIANAATITALNEFISQEVASGSIIIHK
jgi:hypothetical protein